MPYPVLMAKCFSTSIFDEKTITKKKKLIEHTCKADEREGVVSDIPIVSVKNTSEDLGKCRIHTISVKTIFKG